MIIIIINSDNDYSKVREKGHKVSRVNIYVMYNVQSGYHRSVCGGLDCCIRTRVIIMIIIMLLTLA